MAQGEPEEKKIVMGTPEQREEASRIYAAKNWGWYLDDEMEKLHRERLFYSDVVSDYEDLVQHEGSGSRIPAARQSHGTVERRAFNLLHL